MLAVAASMAGRYDAASTDPMMATPSAPPTSRVVSFMAEPMPAFSLGSEPMIDSVAGPMVRPMPIDMIVIEISTCG